MAEGAKLPRFTEADVADPGALTRRLNEFATTLELRFSELEKPLVDPRAPTGGQEVYAVTNALEQRAFDADTVTLPELADVVGTFLTDLFNEGRLR